MGYYKTCEHGRCRPHGGCDCRAMTYYPDTERAWEEDASSHPDAPKKGRWYDFGFEYGGSYWKECDHEPHCGGGVPVAEGAIIIEDGFGKAIERMLAAEVGYQPDHTKDAAARQRAYMEHLFAAAGERP